MERVAFLIEETNERIRCLLNPDSLVMRRTAGVRPTHSAGGHLTGSGLADDPVLYTGGGKTELELDLLFDASLEGSSRRSRDVRRLTGPLWELAENAQGQASYGGPRLVRFVWGKSWNMPGVITGVAERLEQFTEGGVPQRSWMRLRLLRVEERPVSESTGQGLDTIPDGTLLQNISADENQMLSHEVLGGGDGGERAQGERLDEIAARYYGNSGLWRLIAAFNDIADPMRLSPGMVLRIPPLPGGGTAP